jgi:hypothetical protein
MITSRHPQSCDAIGTAAPPRVRALLHERRAWTLACSGARPREVEQALGQASDALTLPDSAEGPDWAAWADETELQVITGRCLTAIGQPRRAIPALRDALAAFDDAQARDKALYLTWLAEAHLETGDIDQASPTLRLPGARGKDGGTVMPTRSTPRAWTAGRAAVSWRSAHAAALCLDGRGLRCRGLLRLRRGRGSGAVPAGQVLRHRALPAIVPFHPQVSTEGEGPE